ncbi:MAG: pilus assembly protein CpaF [Dasania sp.]|jgi:pilus assembly protein CpaF
MFGRRKSDENTPVIEKDNNNLSPYLKKTFSSRIEEPQKGKEKAKEKELEKFYEKPDNSHIKNDIYATVISAIDVQSLTEKDNVRARTEIKNIILEVIEIKNLSLSKEAQGDIITSICDDILGLGPLEPLLQRDDIADIMVNGAYNTYIETEGKIEKTNIKFTDNTQLLNICQRIMLQVGRRVDEASPIADARLLDGSRVNVIAPPLSLDGPTLTIRKFKKDKLKLQDLVNFKAISPEGARLLEIIGHIRCNVVISGGTGSGKTTLLNCLTASIDKNERIITCEDSAELQLQQPHVVRLETRPANIEGRGEITMRDLVKNCLRMRPERIIVGEVRGVEAFDLLQAMNTGHDGSMGTLHANTPREALSRLESMITMGGFSLSSRTIREMIVAAVDVVIQATRLRDGSRKIINVSEIVGIEGDVIVMQEIMRFDIEGEDSRGNLTGRHKSCGIYKPKFWERAQYYNCDKELVSLLEAM